MVLAEIGLTIAAPAAAAVWEVGDDGGFARVDVQPVPQMVAPSRAADRAASFRPAVEKRGPQL